MFFKRKKTKQNQRRSYTPEPTVRSNAVFSYHANRVVRSGSQFREFDREERQKEAALRSRIHKSWLRRLPSIAALLGIMLAIAFSLQLSNRAKVVPVGTSDGQTLFVRDQRLYAEAARKAFTPWANSNKLTINAQKISDDLKQQFPELQAVSVSLPVIGDRPVVYIQPAVPRLILVAKNGVFVLDSNGRALISGNQVPQLSRLNIPAVTDQSNLTIQTGAISLPHGTVNFISEVVDQLNARQLTISSLVLPPGTNELHVQLKGVSYLVKYNLHGRARAEVGAFLAVKQYLEREHKVPHEYIDVRVENKVFYK